jgi:hypothetical protein
MIDRYRTFLFSHTTGKCRDGAMHFTLEVQFLHSLAAVRLEGAAKSYNSMPVPFDIRKLAVGSPASKG